MVYKYVVTLKNRNQKLIDRFSILIMCVSVILFIETLISSGEIDLALLIISMVAIIAFATDIRKQLKTDQPSSFRNALLVTGIAWLAMPYSQWVAIPIIFLALIEKQSKFPLEIGFADDHVKMNSLFRRKYSWADFNHIVLKDGYLTLDLKNNKFIQLEVLDQEDDDGDEEEFNEYCLARLKFVSGET